jgi:hypothetical protein
LFGLFNPGLFRPGPVLRVLLLPPDAAEPDEWITPPLLTPVVCAIPNIERLHKLTIRMIFVFMIFAVSLEFFSNADDN